MDFLAIYATAAALVFAIVDYHFFNKYKLEKERRIKAEQELEAAKSFMNKLVDFTP